MKIQIVTAKTREALEHALATLVAGDIHDWSGTESSDQKYVMSWSVSDTPVGWYCSGVQKGSSPRSTSARFTHQKIQTNWYRSPRAHPKKLLAT